MNARSPWKVKREVREAAIRSLFIEMGGSSSIARLARTAFARGLLTPQVSLAQAEAHCRAALKAQTPDGLQFAYRVPRARARAN